MEQMNVLITMTVAQWNVVMNALGHRPFAEVADIISIIKTQADPQLAAPAAEASDQAE
jgi:2-C-methyl-D-erythritol 4-phosphate cytidylyltransferase